MNPFTIGQSLTVVFGNPQTFTVAAVSPTACAMRFPGLTCAAVKWFSVADLRKWNPQPCVAIVPAYIPVQYPAIVPGLRIQRPLHMTAGRMIYGEQDYTVVAVLKDVAFIRSNFAHDAGSITDVTLRYFWHGDHPCAAVFSYETVALQGHELRKIAAIYRARRAGRNYWMDCLNRGLDQLTPDQWDTLQAGWELRRTERMLRADLRKVAS